MRKIIAILNTVKYNRGSEAIGRSIAKIIHRFEPDAELWIVGNDIDIENLPKYPYIKGFLRKSSVTKRDKLKGGYYILVKKVLRQSLNAAVYRYSALINQCKNADLIICFGCDNFDKHYAMYGNLHELHTVLKQKCNKKMILFDCSFSEDDLTDKVLKDFDLFDEITVREIASLENIAGKYTGSNIHYYPDPAFVMSPRKVELPHNWEKGRMVGINLSGVILDSQYGGNADRTFDAYTNLVKEVVNKGYIPVFIPHVMNGQDYLPLKNLHDECKKFGKMLLLDENYDAEQLKYIISKCSLFIGARTHSTIAAYSSFVPTLVIGYSVKSVGIARDLFGTSENYVLPVSAIKNDMQIANAFTWIETHSAEIQEQLKNVIPGYVQKAYDSYQVLK